MPWSGDHERHSGRLEGGRIPAVSFDQAEQEQLAQTAVRTDMQGGFNGGAGGFTAWPTSISGQAQGGRMKCSRWRY